MGREPIRPTAMGRWRSRRTRSTGPHGRLAARRRSRSQRTVAAIPSSTPIRASQPSSSLAFSTEGQRRWTSTANVGRCSSANASGSSPQASHTMRAISATVSSREAEMLKSSFNPAGEPIAVTTPSAMSSTWVSVRVCSPEPKISSGRWPDEHLLDQVGHRVRDPGLGVGQLARAVGVERAADRVREARARRGPRGSTPRR